MEVGSMDHNGLTNNADEELTSLTWLHDKNLLKGKHSYIIFVKKDRFRTNGYKRNHFKLFAGINLTCATAKSTPENSAINGVQSITGVMSPTSDFLEDSSVSEDNLSSANSSSDQGISIYSTEASPMAYHTISNNNNNNNNISNINMNRNHQLQQHQPQIIHLSPGGTVIEYKTPNLQNKFNAVMQQQSSGAPAQQKQNTMNLQSPTIGSVVTTASLSPDLPTTVITSSMPFMASPSSASSMSPSSTSSSSAAASLTTGSTVTTSTSTSSAHQHFHKKYLREEHNKSLKQINIPATSPIKQESFR